MVIDKIALTLAIIGALNWGGIGLFGFDTVAFLCGGQLAVLSRVIYALVALALFLSYTILDIADLTTDGALRWAAPCPPRSA